MGAPVQLVPSDVLHRFLTEHGPDKPLLVALVGARAYGYPHRLSPVELKGIHIEATERLVGLQQPPRSINWVGEFEDLRIDLSSIEVGSALQQLIRGDGSMLERVMGAWQLLGGETFDELRDAAQGVLCRRYYTYYRAYCRSMQRDYERQQRRTVSHLLTVYRTTLTGVHLLRTGEVELQLGALCDSYGYANLKTLIALNADSDGMTLEPSMRPWVDRLKGLSAQLEEAFDLTVLPTDPQRPEVLEELLLRWRERFFHLG